MSIAAEWERVFLAVTDTFWPAYFHGELDEDDTAKAVQVANIVTGIDKTDDGAGTPPAAPSHAGEVTSLPAPSSPRLFELYRHVDVTGKSGTGVVAHGTQWTDGTVSLRWLGDTPSFANWADLDTVLAVHGHEGATVVRWLSEDDEQHTMSRDELWAKYGVPTKVEASSALDELGLLGEVDPDHVVAFTYASREAADAYAAANLEHWGHPTLGTYETAHGVVGVVDLRPAIAELDRKQADPEAGDDQDEADADHETSHPDGDS